MAVSTGMKMMWDDGILKAMKGITTLDEVFRVAKKPE
jgi:type II secretory ATPase GspE/PulE/Tfp pilus assembly ATPase PilB-like protein